MSRFHLSFTLALLTTVLLGNLGSFSGARANDEPVLGPGEEIFFMFDYKKFKRNRALAIGPNGFHTTSYGHSSVAAAKNEAVAACNKFYEKEVKKKKPGGWCQLYAVNDKIVWEGLSPGVQSDQELPLPDRPLMQGQSFGDLSTATSVLLVLHGCDRMPNPPPDWVMSWINYFLARNFYIYVPDSFADLRRSVCGDAWKTDYAGTVETHRLRIAQTKRTLKEIGRLHPGKPVYVWGHSEGSLIIQSMDVKVAGVIASGQECGNREDHTVVIPRDVPILYVFGERDPFLERFGKTVSENTVKRKCAKRMRKINWVIVKDAGHFTAIWHQNVMDAVSKFIGAESFDLKYRTTDSIKLASVKEAYGREYKSRPKPRAFAYDITGAYGWASSDLSQEDARQNALRICGWHISGWNYGAGLAHVCRIVAE